MDASSPPKPRPARAAAAQIELQAAKWLVHIDRHATPETWAALDSWLVSSPRRRAAFVRLSVAWQRMNGLKQITRL